MIYVLYLKAHVIIYRFLQHTVIAVIWVDRQLSQGYSFQKCNMEIKQFLLQGLSKKTTPTAGNKFPPQTCQRNKAKSNNSPKDEANLSREGFLSGCLVEKYFSSQVCNDPTCMIHYCTVSAVVLSNRAAQCFLQSLKQIARTPESSRLY